MANKNFSTLDEDAFSFENFWSLISLPVQVDNLCRCSYRKLGRLIQRGTFIRHVQRVKVL